MLKTGLYEQIIDRALAEAWKHQKIYILQIREKLIKKKLL